MSWLSFLEACVMELTIESSTTEPWMVTINETKCKSYRQSAELLGGRKTKPCTHGVSFRATIFLQLLFCSIVVALSDRSKLWRQGSRTPDSAAVLFSRRPWCFFYFAAFQRHWLSRLQQVSQLITFSFDDKLARHVLWNRCGQISPDMSLHRAFCRVSSIDAVLAELWRTNVYKLLLTHGHLLASAQNCSCFRRATATSLTSAISAIKCFNPIII